MKWKERNANAIREAPLTQVPDFYANAGRPEWLRTKSCSWTDCRLQALSSYHIKRDLSSALSYQIENLVAMLREKDQRS